MSLRRAGSRLGCLSLALVFSHAASADPTKPPTVEFSAEIVEWAYPDGNRAVSKIYHSKWRYRRDVRPDYSVIIDCPGERMIPLAMEEKVYFLMPISRADCDPINKYLGVNPKAERLGDETINGIAVAKYRVTGRIGDARYEALAWTTKENIVVKMVSGMYLKSDPDKPVPSNVELRNLRIGPVDARLFAIPSNFKKQERP